MNTLSKIYHDESLCGNALITLPNRLMSFSNGEFSLYDNPDPGTFVVDRNYFIARGVHYRVGNRYTFRTQFVGEKTLCDLVEFIGRRILGKLSAVLTLLVFVPLGFSAKIIHYKIRQIKVYICSTKEFKKVNMVWGNPDLFGHFLTSAPSTCYRYAVTPLNWHLREDGTDRRSYIATYTYSGEEANIREAEYSIVPFEIFEFIFKRVIVGTATIFAGAISPFGLMAKVIHLSCESKAIDDLSQNQK